MLRKHSQPDESNRRINLAVASNFIDGVKNDELRTMLATHYTPAFNQCANTRGVETQVKGIPFTEASIEIWILQKHLWQFQQQTSKPR